MQDKEYVIDTEDIKNKIKNKKDEQHRNNLANIRDQIDQLSKRKNDIA